MRVLLLANGRAGDGTGRLFTSLACRLEVSGHTTRLQFREHPKGWWPKIRRGALAELRCVRVVAASDVLCVHTAASLSLFSLCLAALLRKKVVCFLWDIYPQELPRGDSVSKRAVVHVFGVVERFALGRAAVLYVPSSDYLSHLSPRLRAKGVEYPLWVVDPVAATPIRDGMGKTLEVAFAGQINAARGLEVAVRRLAALPSSVPIRLHIFSRDRATDDLLHTANVSETLSIIEHGFVSPVELQEHLRAAHFGLVSLEPRYALPAFPSKIMSYLAAGVPVLYFGPKLPGLQMQFQEYAIGVSLDEGTRDVGALVAAVRDFAIGRERYLATIERRIHALDKDL